MYGFSLRRATGDPPTHHTKLFVGRASFSLRQEPEMAGVVGALLVQVVSFLSLAVIPCCCWTQGELDLFDLVEEVGIGENFYDLMHIDKVQFWQSLLSVGWHCAMC